MTIADLRKRLRKIEAHRLRMIVRPLSGKEERDALVAASLAQPGGMAAVLIAVEAEPNPAVRERSRAVLAAARRADT